MTDYKYKYIKYQKKIGKLEAEIKLLKEDKVKKEKYIKKLSNNKFIYKNTKDKNFINNLSLIENKIDNGNLNYYTLGNIDDMLIKFKNNDKYYKDNQIIKILNYNNNELLFEVSK
tara:strand:- start:216 stop:560 length:345 start_codon:yes stop_codon:yes gene_type:complete